MSDSFVTPCSVASQVLCPWDFPGKNTGVSGHFRLQGIFLTQGSSLLLLHPLYRWATRGAQINYESESQSRSVLSDSLRPAVLYSWWNSPGQNTGVGSRSCLQGIFPTQGSNQGLPHCRQILYHLSHRESPKSTILQFLKQTKKSSRLDVGWGEICKLSQY